MAANNAKCVVVESVLAASLSNSCRQIRQEQLKTDHSRRFDAVPTQHPNRWKLQHCPDRLRSQPTNFSNAAVRNSGDHFSSL